MKILVAVGGKKLALRGKEAEVFAITMLRLSKGTETYQVMPGMAKVAKRLSAAMPVADISYRAPKTKKAEAARVRAAVATRARRSNRKVAC